MAKHRFIGNFNLAGSSVRVTDKGLIHQIGKVLRLQPEDEVFLGDGNGGEAIAQLKSIASKEVIFKIKETYQNQNEPKINAVLYPAILKKDNFEIVVQKATEVGIKEIVPLITERIVKQKIDKVRLEKIAKEAAEQSGRGVIPKIRQAIDFKEAARTASANSLNLFFNPEQESVFELNQNISERAQIGVFVGPEGGWSKKEQQIATEADFCFCGLGKLTLRAETAAVMAGYLAVNLKAVTIDKW